MAYQKLNKVTSKKYPNVSTLVKTLKDDAVQNKDRMHRKRKKKRGK